MRQNQVMNQSTGNDKNKNWVPQYLILMMSLIFVACAMKPDMLKIEGIEKSLVAGDILDAESGELINFDQLLGKLEKIRIIYVGERHTSREHHRIQLEIVKALSERGKQIRVGMEMFDHTYQPRLNQWTAGGLQWEDFLMQVHWYANWKFDDTLYKELLIYLKDREIPLVGLNIPFYLSARIAVGGLENLSKADRKLLPAKIDTTIADHRTYVEEIFNMHKMKGRDDFNNFYAAQCAWEDGMAQAVADNLADETMVVIAGNGHIIRKFGIPNRAFARTGAAFRTIYLVTPGMTVSPKDGDFIWVTPKERMGCSFFSSTALSLIS